METKPQNLKNREAKARRQLKKHDYNLIKSRAKNQSCNNNCGYQIRTVYNGAVEWGLNYELTIEAVEDLIQQKLIKS